MATLVVRDKRGNTVARLDVLPDRAVHAGRTAENELVLKENSVSRRHACFEYVDGRLIVRDLKSANGVIVGGVRIRGPQPVGGGEHVKIGSFDVEVLDEGGGAGGAPEITTAHLVALDGPYRAETFALDKDVVTVGRVAGNDIVLDDASISRRHARVLRQGASWSVEDLGSSNGTSIGGGKVTRSPLNDGDRVGFGDVMFQFRLSAGKRGAKDAAPASRRAEPTSTREPLGPRPAPAPAGPRPALASALEVPARPGPEPTPFVAASTVGTPSAAELPTGPAPALEVASPGPAGTGIVRILLLLVGFFGLAVLSALVAWFLTE